jgi:putative ubiquitin-RnfH superfamily antitoxin RatB of RatAB toxin-antitoxin module
VATIRVSVVWATAVVHDIVPLELPEGAVVGDAVRASGLPARYAVDAGSLRFAVGGRTVPDDAPLAAGDRVEICRPLVVDPKEARRLRAAARQRP